MVKVKVVFQQDKILEVDINDHADSNIHGQDLVCAGVSCISVGILNTLNELYEDACDLLMDEAHVRIVVKDKMNEGIQIVLKTMYIQLLTMEENYGEFIKITKVEV